MTKNKKGFTIIEVVLVLAIAGLIFLMVFIALPALQRSQRNTRRRQDMARILSAFTDYQSNNGKSPASSDLGDFVNKYVKNNGTSGNPTNDVACESDQFCDPDGTSYRIVAHDFAMSHYGGGTESTATYDGTGGRGNPTPKENRITHVIHYWPNGKCSGTEGTIEKSEGANNVAIAYYLEGGAIYCGDNQ